MRIAPLILLLTALVPLRAAAQPVIGVVEEEGTSTPIPGAMVILFDSTGTQVDRVLSNAAGKFLVRARDPGPHYITVDRIGYASWTTDPFEPELGGQLLTIQVPVEAIPLKGLDVSGSRRCEVRPEEGQATARVWEEVRKALAAEEYTREASLYRYTLARYNRKLDRDARETIEADTTIAENLSAAFRAFPVEYLVGRGFVQATVDTTTIYFAPDAGALISDAFLDTHCFGLREGEDGRIGLIFRPLEGRPVPEIGGVLWVDAATSELERLEYVYLNLVRSREVGEPGGEVAFTRLPDGAWIVREWRIRMPHLETGRRGRLRRTAYGEEGGVTRAITDARGRTILHVDAASISGVVTDSAGTGPPPEPVVVELAGTVKQAITDEDGSFLLTGLAAGRHVLRVQRQLLATWGIAPPDEVVVEGRLGEVAHVRLRTPSVADALAASCGRAPRPEGTVAFLGRITTADGGPMADMKVGVQWLRASGYSAAAVAAPLGAEGTPDRAWTIGREGAFATAATTTDWRGLIMLCDVPAGSRLRVSVSGPTGNDPVLRETYFVAPGVPAVVERLIIPTAGSRRSTAVDKMESVVDRPPPDSGVDAGRDAEIETPNLESFSGVWVHEETRKSSHGYGDGLRFQFLDEVGVPPQEMVDAIGLEIRTRASQLTVQVEDSLFAVSGDAPGWSFELPLDGSERAVVQDSTGVEFSVSLTWRDGTPVVQRSFGSRGAVFDAYEITEDDVLVVTRTARMGAQASTGTVQYVYVRSAQTGPPTPPARTPPRR